MKILTLNTHSLMEENYLRKLAWFVELVLMEMPDMIALQEVNQSADAAAAEPELLSGMAASLGEIPVRSDNHAAWAAWLLSQAGAEVSWVWLPVKLGYGRFDEGLALLSLCGPIADTDVLQLTDSADYANWKTRKALGVRVAGMDDWFYNVHLGWWNDAEEPFARQWGKLQSGIAARERNTNIWLMGDFNSPAEVRAEGYDLIASDGWQDAWRMAETSVGSVTVDGEIDGWREESRKADGMRVDQIWCRRQTPVRSAKVVFDGKSAPRVSDHFGVLLEMG